MSEVTETIQPVAPTDSVSSAGAMLRSAREASGLHVAALAVAMKVPVKKLEALESNRFDLLLDAVFVRALAASVCRTLKIDPAPILEKLPQSIVPRLSADQQGINTPYYAPGYARKLVMPTALGKPSVLAVIALLVAAVFLVLFPRSQPVEKLDDSTQAGFAAQLTNSDVGSKGASASESIVGSTVVNMTDGNSQVKVLAASTVSAESIIPTAVVSDIVTFKARGTSWVEVTDGKGMIQLRKTLASGESVSTSGVLPLSVVVGRADLTDVIVRGQLFSIEDMSKDNVARFEVK